MIAVYSFARGRPNQCTIAVTLFLGLPTSVLSVTQVRRTVVKRPQCEANVRQVDYREETRCL